MATAGEGPSSTPSLGYGGNGGVGGKFRKRPFRTTHTTPYDRPPTALRNPSWLSKLVEPATKLIGSVSQRFLASASRKRLTAAPPPPPPPPPELNQDSGIVQPERVQEAAQGTTVGEGINLTHSPSNGGISDLEQLLKKKTFTRSEIDRLTELLHSRAVDFSPQSDVRRTESNNGILVANSDMQQQYVASPSHGISTRNDLSHGLISTPDIRTRVLEEDIASPAAIAKAYMGSQASKVSPSMLGTRVGAIREDATLLNNAPYTPKSTMLSLATKTVSHSEAPENGYTTPRSRGRSAIYNMARTPYSRVHQTAFEKGSGSRLNGFGVPLLPVSSGEGLHGMIGSNRMGLKRRSSALDDDYGSVGPMRRIRQKPSLLSHRNYFPQGVGGVSTASQQPTNERSHKGPKFAGGNDDNRMSRASYAHVPPKSTETASKILEHLERMTPKTKSADLKLISAKEKSPAKLTTDMLRGQALKSLEDTDSSKLLCSDQAVSNMEIVSHGKEVLDHGSTQENDIIEENKSQKFGSPRNMLAPAEYSDITTSGRSTFKSAETSDSVVKFVAQRPQEKRAFTMSAHEDWLDLDDDTYPNSPASEVLPKGNANTEMIENKHSFLVEKSLPNKLSVSPEKRTPGEPIFGKRLDSGTADVGSVRRDKAPSLEVTAVPSSSGSDNPKPVSDEGLGSENSSFLTVREPADPKPFSLSAKPDITNRSDGISTAGTNDSSRSPGSERGIVSTFQGAAITNGKLGTSSTEGVSPGGVIPNGVPALRPLNYSPASSPASTGFVNSFLTNGTSNVSSSVGAASSSVSAPSWSTEPAALSKTSVFNLGSSGNPSVSISSTPNAELPATKTGKDENAGNSIDFSSGNTPVAKVGTGTGIFGFNSKVTSPPTVSQPLDSLSNPANSSIFKAPSPGPGSEVSSVTTSAPVLFGGSTSSPVIGASGIFTSSSSMTTAATLSNSDATNVGNRSSGLLSESKSFVTSTGANSSWSSFNANASSSPSISNVTATDSGKTPAFIFGGSSSAAVSATANATHTAAAAPVFAFAASSSAGMVSTSSGSIGAFGVSPSPSFTGSNPASSSGATTSGIFGNISQAPKPSSPFGGPPLSPSPSTGYSFGGSSSFGTAPMVFGANTGGSSGPVVSFTSSTFSTPAFGGTSSFPAPATNNDQMSTEDSMAEDPVQSAAVSAPAAPVFGQQPVSPAPGGFTFGSPAPLQANPFASQAPSQANPFASPAPSQANPFASSAPLQANPFASSAPSQANPFQFGAQQTQAPFHATGSQEFGGGGGSFSLGSGGSIGGDKSSRRVIKVRRNANKKR